MTKTITLVIGDNGALNAISGGDVTPIEAARACQTAALSFLNLVEQPRQPEPQPMPELDEVLQGADDV